QLSKVPPRPSWEFYHPELDQLVADLQSRREALDQRERELTDWETRLRAEREELQSVLRQIDQKRSEIEKRHADFEQALLRVREEEVANLKRLAKLYAAMAPETAVAMLTELKDDDIVKILAQMKDAQVVTILETLAGQGGAQARRAAHLTERLRVLMSANPSEKKS
ncbi:MAG: hypothetical protein RMM51_02195, partial [Verrucomicrobiae bacterium]|nr:hypothetical protein [Verrucomicrobiae bacterium]